MREIQEGGDAERSFLSIQDTFTVFDEAGIFRSGGAFGSARCFEEAMTTYVNKIYTRIGKMEYKENFSYSQKVELNMCLHRLMLHTASSFVNVSYCSLSPLSLRFAAGCEDIHGGRRSEKQ